ncbi:NAPDH dehydrogenase [Scheffersomyces coipomensis]|uniref:NAPDH dehydrogenase n=1 Tax=Scheffersomyces coipomensis TaxID=1788519 RepID=UPI00315D046B
MTIPSLSQSNLFKPLQVGNVTLNQRIAHLPTTRFRASSEHIPTDLLLKYYTDRSITPGTLLITEATLASEKVGLYANVPGIWNEQQAQAWKKVNDSIHEAGSFVSLQLWALGRAGNPKLLKEKGLDFVAPSPIYHTPESQTQAEEVGNPIREITLDEIHDLIYNQYPNAIKNAIAAGFDIIEFHSANGYLLEQFIDPSSNHRTDKYGGSIENRTRIVLEIIDNLIEQGIDAKKLAIRLSPFRNVRGHLGEKESVHPIATYGYLVSELQQRANKGHALSYISVIENAAEYGIATTDFISQIWKGPIVRAAAYSLANDFSQLVKDVDVDDRTIIGFGRYFISNPDLVDRLKHGYELTPFEAPNFYTNSNLGYNTYPFYNKTLEYDEETEKAHSGKPLA